MNAAIFELKHRLEEIDRLITSRLGILVWRFFAFIIDEDEANRACHNVV